MWKFATGCAALLMVAACGGSEGGPGAAPKSAFPLDAEISQDVSAAPALLGEVMTHAGMIDPVTPPAPFEWVDIKKSGRNCRMPKPRGKAKVAYVYTYSAGKSEPVHFVENHTGRKKGEKLAKAFISATSDSSLEGKAMGGLMGAAYMAEAVERTGRHDVVVTDTSAPVFLYLSSYEPILWNIQLAPGAKLDGVVVNAYNGGVIANGADANRTGFGVMAKDTKFKCWKKNYGRAMPEGTVPEYKQHVPQRARERHLEEMEEVRQWHKKDLPKLIGRKPTWYIYPTSGVILVGPKPEAPIAPQPITRLQVPEIYAPFYGKRKDAINYFKGQMGG